MYNVVSSDHFKIMASKRRLRRRACENKHRFNSLQDALDIKHKYQAQMQEAYKCPRCGGFHLGRRSRQRQRQVEGYMIQQTENRYAKNFKKGL